MGGRFLLGFGVSIAASAGPMYVVEINHPAYRGVVGAMYNTLVSESARLETTTRMLTRRKSGFPARSLPLAQVRAVPHS